MLSSTVTFAVQLPVLPAVSSTVKVTVTVPASAQVNTSGATLMEAMAQTAVLPLSISAAVMLATPEAFNSTVASWHNAVGAGLSMVTTLVQLELLPFTSVTVRVTTLSPALAQPNRLGSTLNDAIPHPSVLPPSTSVSVINAERWHPM